MTQKIEKQDMEQRHMEQKRTEKLKEFDKELFSYTGKVAWFLTGVGMLLPIGCMLMPPEGLGTGFPGWIINILIASVWTPLLVLLPYIDTTDALTPRAKKSGTYGKVRYLPVGKKVYVRVRMGYMFRFLWKLAIVGTALQCGVSYLDDHRIAVGNILYALCVLFVLPMFFGWVILQTDR